MSTSSGSDPKSEGDAADQISDTEYLGAEEAEKEKHSAAEPEELEARSNNDVDKPEQPSNDEKLRTRRRYLIGLAVLLIVLLVAVAGVSFYFRSSSNEPAQTVESFLEAVHDKDFDAAMDVVSDYSVPPSNVTVIGPEALSSDWEIGRIEVTNHGGESSGDTAEVSTEIIGPEDTSVTTTMQLQMESDEWKIRNPFTQIQFPAAVFDYFRVNGVDIEIADEEHPTPSVYFFPGVYEYFDDDMEILEPTFDSVVKLAGDSNPVNVKGDHKFASFTVNSYDEDPAHRVEDNFTLRDDANATSQQHVEEYIDECADETSLENDGCPISADSFDLSRKVNEEDLSLQFSSAEVKWDIKDYPDVEVLYDARLQHEGALHFTNQTSGLVELSTSVEDSQTGNTHEFTFECDINVEPLRPHLDDTGNFHIGPLEPSNSDAEHARHYESEIECALID